MKRDRQVFWFYQRVHVTSPVMQVYFELAGGLCFHLRRVHMIQPEYYVPAVGAKVAFPFVNVELTDGTGVIRWQREAIPAQLYSAPRYNDVTVKTETAPADKKAFGVNLSTVFKPRANTVNLFYDKGENIFVRLSGFELLTPPGYLCPNYLDLAIEGTYRNDNV